MIMPCAKKVRLTDSSGDRATLLVNRMGPRIRRSPACRSCGQREG
jgi:hypothetical protein